MRTLITLIIGIIIGAAGLFYGMKNGMVKLNMNEVETPAETAHKPHAQAAPAAHHAAAPAPRTKAAAPVAEIESDDEDGFED